MSFTENLELRVVDNDDNFGDTFTQGNYNANKLEEKIGGYLDDLESLPDMRTDINTLQTSVAEHSVQISNINSNINAINTQLGSRITAIENGKGFYINEDGERIDGIITRYVLETSTTGSRGELPVNETSTERDVIVSLNASVILNLTELIGLISMQNKKLINANCYVSTFDTSRGAVPSFTINGIFKPPYQNYYVISFTAEKTTIAHQTYFPATSSWLPSVAGNYQDIPVTIVFDIFEESNLPE